MKSISLYLMLLVAIPLFVQSNGKVSTEVTLPSETAVLLTLVKDIEVPDTRKGTSPFKIGDKVDVVVKEDVLVNGVVVIKKGTPANAVIRELVPLMYNFKASRSPNNEGQITLDIIDVTAVDGTIVKLRECFLQVYATTLPAGSIKVGKVPVSYKIAVP